MTSQKSRLLPDGASGPLAAPGWEMSTAVALVVLHWMIGDHESPSASVTFIEKKASIDGGTTFTEQEACALVTPSDDTKVKSSVSGMAAGVSVPIGPESLEMT